MADGQEASWDRQPVVLGRPSPAAAAAPRLAQCGGAAAGSPLLRADAGDSGAWSLRAASVTGVRHRLAGAANQDAYAWMLAGDGAVVVALADGVGGEAGSGQAATAAAGEACRAARDALLAGETAGDAARTAVWAANAAAAAAAGATTVVVVVAGVAGAYRAARVGDSTVVALDGDRWIDVFVAAHGEEGGRSSDDLVGTATAALPAESPEIEEAGGVVDHGGVVAVMSDGLAVPLRDGPTTVAPAFAAALSEPPRPVDLVALVDFSRQGCHDDRTLLGLWRRPAGGVAPGILAG